MNNYLLSDIVAQSLLSMDFPGQYIAMMNHQKLSNVGITDFYEAFCAKNGIVREEGKNILFTPALVLGHLYTVFLLPRESLFKSIEEDIHLKNIQLTRDKWGIQIQGNSNDTTLPYVARRMRNALAHNSFVITKTMEFKFRDVNKNNDEVFYNFSFDDLCLKFLPEWQNIIVPLLIQKEGRD